jgi:hypothetical protein
MWIVFTKQVQLRPVPRPFLALCWKLIVEGTRWFLIALVVMFLVKTVF